MTGERELLIRHRLERARETLDEARLLGEAGHWNASVNRLYYACFYAVTALLLRDNLSSSKHSGVLSLFNRHFVRTGTVSQEMATLYRDLFDGRQKGDYLDFARFEEDQVRPWTEQAERFVQQVADMLQAGPQGSRSD